MKTTSRIRVMVTLPADFYNQLAAESIKTNIPIAALLRSRAMSAQIEAPDTAIVKQPVPQTVKPLTKEPEEKPKPRSAMTAEEIAASDAEIMRMLDAIPDEDEDDSPLGKVPAWLEKH